MLCDSETAKITCMLAHGCEQHTEHAIRIKGRHTKTCRPERL